MYTDVGYTFIMIVQREIHKSTYKLFINLSMCKKAAVLSTLNVNCFIFILSLSIDANAHLPKTSFLCIPCICITLLSFLREKQNSDATRLHESEHMVWSRGSSTSV